MSLSPTGGSFTIWASPLVADSADSVSRVPFGAVEQNVYIRNLHKIQRCFSDATPFQCSSGKPHLAAVVSLSLAIEYQIA